MSSRVKRLLSDNGCYEETFENNIMITCSPKLSASQVSDSQCSLTSSTRTSKRIERSSSKNSNRSLSRESNPGVLKNFFVKSVCAEQLLRENGIRNIPETEIKRKRDPTPCKSKKLIGSNKNAVLNESNKIKDLEMTVAMSEIREEVNKKDYILAKLDHENKSMKMEIDSLEKQMKAHKEKITKLSHEISQLNLKLEEAQQNNIKLEEVVLLGEQNLANAKSSLDKIKKSIKENRTLDLKKENEAYKNKIEIFMKSICLLEMKIKEKESLLEEKEADNIALKSGFNSDLISYKEIFLENEIQRLKGILGKTEEEKEFEMFKCLKSIEQEKDALRKEVERLNIQLDYIFRVHFEEIKIFAKAKSDELTKQKKKYKDLQEEFEEKEKEWEEKLLERETRNLRSFHVVKNGTPHSSIFSTDERSREFSISFSLSPE